MYLVFYRTSDVFEAEEIMQNNGFEVEIAPTPVQEKAYCGVCLMVNQTDYKQAQILLSDLEYQLVP